MYSNNDEVLNTNSSTTTGLAWKSVNTLINNPVAFNSTWSGTGLVYTGTPATGFYIKTN
jgi:hypothetical protein